MMKKVLFGMMGAIALAFTACTSDDAVVVNNPNYDAETNSVKTSFAFNVATSAKTRATATEVQDGTTFRGMDAMALFVAKAHPMTVEFQEGHKYDLGELSTGALSASQSSKVYNLTFPLQVNNMVFYGKAAGNGSDATAYKRYGKLGYNVGTTKATTHFDLTPIASATTDFEARTAALAYILNDIISAEAVIVGPETPENPQGTEEHVTWASTVTTAETNILYMPLADAYKEITTIGAKELRLGSGPAIIRMINDLYIVCSNMATASTTPEEIKAIAQAIDDKIGIYFTTSPFDVKNMTSLKTSGSAEFQALVANMNTGDLKNFPTNLNLPSGAAQLQFTNNKFSYVTTPGTLRNATVAGVNKFTFPAELCYWQCSPIRTSANADVVIADYPITVANWDAETWPNDKTWVRNSKIASDTRAVAFQNNIQYAVAALKTTVEYSATTLKDNNHAIQKAKDATLTDNDEPDAEIAVKADLFSLQGILVGDQPAKVEWNWVAAASTARDMVVYDTYFSNAAIPASGTSEPVYTMVLDNYNAGKAANEQDVVCIALELKNNGEDFWGADNLIRHDGIFYLAAKLDLKNLTEAQKTAILAQYPENSDTNGYRYPPLKSDLTNDRVIRAFMQDFITVAKLKIGENSLKAAYATVPDLRAAEMTFGLSVDLEWRAGAQFEIEFTPETAAQTGGQ